MALFRTHDASGKGKVQTSVSFMRCDTMPRDVIAVCVIPLEFHERSMA